MTNGRDQLISDRAYAIWEAEGSPKGRDREHWEQACREIADAESDAAARPEAPALPALSDSAGTPPDAKRARKPKEPAAAAAKPIPAEPAPAAKPKAARRRPA